MRKFWMLMKMLTASRSLFIRKHTQPFALSVAYCNPALVCCNSTTTNTTTNNFTHDIQNDSAKAGSFFFPPVKKPVLISLKGFLNTKQEEARNKEQGASNKQPATGNLLASEHRFFELLALNNEAMKKNKISVGENTKRNENPIRIFLRRVSIFTFTLLIAILFFSNKAVAQTDAINFDFNDNNAFVACNSDNTYTGNSGDETVNDVTIPSGATIGSITLEASYGVFRFFQNPTGTINFFLNGFSVGSFQNFQGTCHTDDITISSDHFNADGPNVISFTSSGSSGSTRLVYNVSLTINYSVCIPPDVPDGGVDFCLNATSNALTADGDNLLWYSAPDDPTGSPDAPVPATNATGTTAYYVTQTVGCESDKAEIDVAVNPVPTSSVTGFTNISCFGASDGSITVQGNDGSGSYEYSIDDGAMWTATFSSDPYQFMGLSAQEYKIRVKDSNGCISKEVQ